MCLCSWHGPIIRIILSFYFQSNTCLFIQMDFSFIIWFFFYALCGNRALALHSGFSHHHHDQNTAATIHAFRIMHQEFWCDISFVLSLAACFAFHLFEVARGNDPLVIRPSRDSWNALRQDKLPSENAEKWNGTEDNNNKNDNVVDCDCEKNWTKEKIRERKRKEAFVSFFFFMYIVWVWVVLVQMKHTHIFFLHECKKYTMRIGTIHTHTAR